MGKEPDNVKKPNILFILCDQLRADVLGCMGGPAATPNIDALAAEGLCFTNCMTVAPLCVPARISLMTGKYPHSTGAWNNAPYILSPDADLWPKVIRGQGYATSVFGKLHLHSDYGDMIAYEPVVQGYGFDTVNEISGPHSSTQTRTHLSEMWKAKGLWEDYCLDMDTRKEPFARPSPLQLEDYYDVYVGREGRNYLENYSGTQPWFCHISFGGPHEPWDTPKPYADMYAPEAMPKPLPQTRSLNPARPTGMVDKNLSKPALCCGAATAAALRADYCGAVSLIDKQIGDIIETVKRRGEWDNTVVLISSDHGELNGDHGMVKKRNFYRGALNVPLVIRTPDSATRSSHKCGALVSLIDIGPTLTDYAGGELSYTQFGRSLRALVESGAESFRDCLISELAGELMYMDRRWKMVTNAQGEVYQLFDLEKGPDELLNLAGAEEYKETETQLTIKLFRELAANRCLTATVMQMTEPPLSEEFVAGYGDSVALRPRRMS